MRQMYAVERRWKKPPPAPMPNHWETVWVNFNDYDDAWVCAVETALDGDAFRTFDFRVVEQGRVYGVAA